MLSTFNTESLWLQPHPKLQNVSMMDRLFSRLNGAYPNRWRSSFRDEFAIEDWKVAWAEAFDGDGITPDEVALGIKNCRRMYDWPPSLTEFLRACRPALDPEAAFHEAVKGLSARRKGEMGQWSHPAIYYASIGTGQHDMLNSTYGHLKARWGRELAEQLEKQEWAPIPKAQALLPKPAKTDLSNKQAKAAMEKIGAAGVLDKSGFDHKKWAQKILSNPRGRSPAIIEMASSALDGVAA